MPGQYLVQKKMTKKCFDVYASRMARTPAFHTAKKTPIHVTKVSRKGVFLRSQMVSTAVAGLLVYIYSLKRAGHQSVKRRRKKSTKKQQIKEGWREPLCMHEKERSMP
jgi:hypothetical protein